MIFQLPFRLFKNTGVRLVSFIQKLLRGVIMRNKEVKKYTQTDRYKITHVNSRGGFYASPKDILSSESVRKQISSKKKSNNLTPKEVG